MSGGRNTRRIGEPRVSTRCGLRLALWMALSIVPFTSAATARPVSADATELSNDAQSTMSEAELQSSMKHLIDTYNGIKDARARIVAAPVRMTRDLHGRTLSDDVRESVLAGSVRERLNWLLRVADDSLSAHDLPSANAALVEAAAILERERKTYDAIDAYWKRRGSQRPNRTPYLANLHRNGLEPRYEKEIEASEARFEQQIEGRQFIEAMFETLPLLQGLYQKSAEEDAIQIRAAMERRNFVPFRAQDGNAKCSRATRKASGAPQPKMVSNVSIYDYYPATSREMGETGQILLDILVSRNGCPTRAYVTVSSGYERLDTAALSYALHASYRPAEIGGRIVTARMPLMLNFELTERGRDPDGD